MVGLIKGERGRIVMRGGRRVREYVTADGGIVYGEAPPKRAYRTSPDKSGVKGVSWRDKDQRWVVTGTHDGRSVMLGRFRYLVDAVDCRMVFESHGYEEARLLGDLEKENIKAERLAAAKTRDEQRAALGAKRKEPKHAMPYPHLNVVTGEPVEHGPQWFVCIGVQQYETSSGGRYPAMHIWQGECIECGKPYTFRVQEYAKTFSPTRRCVDHRHMPNKKRIRYKGAIPAPVPAPIDIDLLA